MVGTNMSRTVGLASVSHFCTTFVICSVDLIKIGSWKFVFVVFLFITFILFVL